MSEFDTREDCRFCGSRRLGEVFRDERLPIAGTYLTEAELGREPLPSLTVVVCHDCGLVQLRELPPPSLYAGYRFVGSGSQQYRAHIEWVAAALADRFGVAGKRILEVGCSDGALLRLLRGKGAAEVFGFEPSSPLRRACAEAEIATSAAFFGRHTRHECPFDAADAIVVRHVMEHVDDLNDFAAALADSLASDGVLVVEVPDLDAIVQGGLYAHFYHEHLSYFRLGTLRRPLEAHGFEVAHQQRVDVHGGSLFAVCRKRPPATARPAPASDRVDVASLRRFAEERRGYIGRLGQFVREQRERGVRLVGYGAAHRTTVLCSLAGLGREHVSYLVDKNPLLHGLYTPGAHLPIYGVERLSQDVPDALAIFASSFEGEIRREQEPFVRAGGRLISLMPEPRYIE